MLAILILTDRLIYLWFTEIRGSAEAQRISLATVRTSFQPYDRHNYQHVTCQVSTAMTISYSGLFVYGTGCSGNCVTSFRMYLHLRIVIFFFQSFFLLSAKMGQFRSSINAVTPSDC
jgi:hypothetical protein